MVAHKVSSEVPPEYVCEETKPEIKEVVAEDKCIESLPPTGSTVEDTVSSDGEKPTEIVKEDEPMVVDIVSNAPAVDEKPTEISAKTESTAPTESTVVNVVTNVPEVEVNPETVPENEPAGP